MPAVIAALELANHIRKTSAPNIRNVDAYDNDPTTLLSFEDKKKLILKSLDENNQKENWIDFVLSLTFSLSTFVRGNEYRAIRYPYIRLDQNGLHCPYPNGPMSSCLINIREPNSTKTKLSMKTTTGGWRHKEFFYVGMLC